MRTRRIERHEEKQKEQREGVRMVITGKVSWCENEVWSVLSTASKSPSSTH